MSSGYCAPRTAVPISASPTTRSGWASARSIAVWPPIEAATTTARLTPAGVEHGDGVGGRRPAVLALVRRLALAARVVGDAAVAGSQALDHVPPAAPVGDAGVDAQDVGAALGARDVVRELRA
jgi:hypothetical protein